MNTFEPKTKSDNAVQQANRPTFGASMAALLLAAVFAILLVGTFWAGHEFWPKEKIGSAINTQPSAPGGLTTNGSNMLSLTENTISRLAEQSSKSVVSISTDTSIVINELPFNNLPHPFTEFFGFDDQLQGPHKFHQRGSGSGLIVRSDGYILTNNHVVRNADSIKVNTSDNRTFEGKVVGRDSFTDLALVKVDASNLPVARFGNSNAIKAGDWAIAIGSPLGLSHTVTLGIISALARPLTGTIDLIQTDAAINPGNSGGPLLNIRGEVIGVNTAIYNNAQNIGFAIPIAVARDVVDQLLEHGKVERAWVGISMQDMNAQLAKSLGVKEDTKGAVIAKVEDGSPADRANLEKEDIIQRIDGVPVGSAKDVQAVVHKHRPNDTLRLKILRDNKEMEMTIKLGDFPQQVEK